MVGFVEQSAGEQFLSSLFENFAADVLSANCHFIRARDVLPEIRNAQTSFTLRVLAFPVNNFRIDKHQLGLGIFLERYIDDGDSTSNTNLRRGQPDAVSRIHRLEHVIDQLFQVFIEDRNCFRRLLENWIAVLYDGIDHQNFFSCSRYPSKLRIVSVMESPPNFSSAHLARVRATIASPATPAAGTTHTSERS